MLNNIDTLINLDCDSSFWLLLVVITFQDSTKDFDLGFLRIKPINFINIFGKASILSLLTIVAKLVDLEGLTFVIIHGSLVFF